MKIWIEKTLKTEVKFYKATGKTLFSWKSYKVCVGKFSINFEICEA